MTKQTQTLPTDLLSTSEAADLLKVNRASIRRWVHQGRIAGFRIGAHLKVSKADVVAFAARVQPDSGPMIETRASVVARADLVDETLRRAGIRK